jgi:transposase
MLHLTLSQQEKIVTRRCDGISAAQIAIEESISERTVRHVYQQWKKNGTVEIKPKSGRPPIFNDRKRRELGRVVRASSRATLKEISQLISAKASEDTIRNELRKFGYASPMAVKKPFLNENQQKARYIFAKTYAHWTVDDWRKVSWKDESSFEIGKLSSQPRVWRNALEKYKKECLASTFKSGRTSIMVWGAIAGGNKSKLVFMKKDHRSPGGIKRNASCRPVKADGFTETTIEEYKVVQVTYCSAPLYCSNKSYLITGKEYLRSLYLQQLLYTKKKKKEKKR